MATGYSVPGPQSRRDEKSETKRVKEKRSEEKLGEPPSEVGLHGKSSKVSINQKERYRSRSQSSRSHLWDNDGDDYETLEVFKNDFQLLLAVSPMPDDAFCPKSTDYQLALHWYKRLSTWQCETLDELRMRHVYMSHLSVCFNQKSLRGIFNEVPPDELVWVDFTEILDSKSLNTSAIANISAWQTMNSLMLQKSEIFGCTCSNRTSRTEQQSCDVSATDSRYAGGCSKRRVAHKTPLHTMKYRSRPKLVPRHFAQLHASSFTSSNLSYIPHCSTSSSLQLSVRTEVPVPVPARGKSEQFKIIGHRNHRKPMDEHVRRNMNYLLETIKAELRGETCRETNEILELELSRYRELYARHRPKDPQLKANLCSGPEENRIYMLLKMQNALVKLLSN
ncbi:uncharacterized protein LOC116806459 [Drosophila grimshawi]|uniref:uncharacterized protein LOC116806459 n=1 Tax=Drosophila grimshawi TaxID=7222 RepID=UPI000C86F4CB|nr:uncharacterized protein LOC116806459 [Drosophila grimshawi]